MFDNVPGFVIRIQDLARYPYDPSRSFVEYAWRLSNAYVENISASYVTAIHPETRANILDYLAELEPQREAEFQKEDWTKLCNVFDFATEEVWGLLNQAWKRYVRSSYFTEFKMSDNGSRNRALTLEMTEALRKRQATVDKKAGGNATELAIVTN